MAWKHFDFDGRWDEFWAAWCSDDVQDQLDRDMRWWCAEQAYLGADGERPTWTRQPLWELSRTDFWANKFMDRANEITQDFYGEYANVAKARGLPRLRPDAENYGMCDCDGDGDSDGDGKCNGECRGAFERAFDEAYKRAMRELAPRPGTLESLVMVMGGEYLAPALRKVAKLLFPGCKVTHRGHPVTVRTPEENVRLSPIDYYFDKHRV